MTGEDANTPAFASDVSTRFFGELQTRRCWEGAVLMSFRHPTPRVVPKHEHPVPHFTLILSGNYEEVSRRGTYQYQGFTAAFHPAHTEHRGLLPDGHVSCFSVEIGETWLDPFRGPDALREPVYELQASEITWLALKLFREYRTGEDASELAMESLVWEMLGAAARMQHRRHCEPEWWGRALGLLHDRFREGVRIANLADETGVHPVYFARVFRQVTGMNAGAYLQNLRVQHACRRLGDWEMPLSEIAADAGFADQSHMTRVFRRMIGTTPGELRRALTASRRCQ